MSGIQKIKVTVDIFDMNATVHAFKVFGCPHVCVYSFKEVVKGN